MPDSEPLLRYIVLGGCRIALVDRSWYLRTVRQYIIDPPMKSIAFASANLDHIHWFGRKSPNFGAIDTVSTSVTFETLLDGAPLSWIASAISRRRCERLSGADLLLPTLRLADELGATVGFLGGKPEMHERLQQSLLVETPNLKDVHYWAPSRSTLTDSTRSSILSDEIADAGCDLLVIGLGKPLQELWAANFGRQCGTPVILLFGASADFLAGTVARAPKLLQGIGGEWLFRLLQEPKRLSRRYLLEAPLSLLQVLAFSERIDKSTIPR